MLIRLSGAEIGFKIRTAFVVGFGGILGSEHLKKHLVTAVRCTLHENLYILEMPCYRLLLNSELCKIRKLNSVQKIKFKLFLTCGVLTATRRLNNVRV